MENKEHNYNSNMHNDMQKDEILEYELSDPKEVNNDELLIDAVRGYPHLYDTSLKDYKDANMKDNSWGEIAKIMNMSGKIKILIFWILYL